MTLACEDGDSILVEVVTVVDVDDEDEELLFRRFEVLRLKFRQDLKLEFGQYFAAVVL